MPPRVRPRIGLSRCSVEPEIRRRPRTGRRVGECGEEGRNGPLWCDPGHCISPRRPGTPRARPRFMECCEALLEIDAETATGIPGSPDDLKLRSGVALFSTIGPSESACASAMDPSSGFAEDRRHRFPPSCACPPGISPAAGRPSASRPKLW
ncbi:MAG: DUF1810 family protein [Akkermansiaceae bacterium]|nr:DUF1810 family protein [Akkermansiaceae bacterium]